MSAPQYQLPARHRRPSGNSNLKTALAAGAIIASLAANGFLLYQVHDLRTDTAKGREIMQNEIDTLKENSTVMTATQRKHLDDLKEELDVRSREAQSGCQPGQERGPDIRRPAGAEARSGEPEDCRTM